jgi:choline dehydrogenase-like flavoprotein
MRPMDCRRLPKSNRIETDVCIVGGGIAGMSIAREFIGTRHDVCVIESGGDAPDEATQSLYDLASVGYPVRQNFMARARYFGGTSNLWAGRSMRLDPIDFQRREWVPDSGWPIDYTDLERYYTRAERILRLPDVGRLMETLARFSDGAAVERALFHDGGLRPRLVVWGRRPLRFRKAFRRQLSGGSNIRIFLNGNATEIVVNDAGNRVDALVAATLNGNQLRISARTFVLACGGLENARLLLVSRGRHANGVGNSQDIVGRYFMDHPRAILGRVRLSVPFRSSLLLGAPLPDGKVQIGIGPSEERQRRDRMLNSCLTLEPRLSEIAQQAYQGSANVVKVLMRKGYAGRRSDVFRAALPEIRDLVYLLTPREIVPHVIYRHSARLKALIRGVRKVHDLTVINFCEQVPRRESRVFLGTRRDRLGMNSLVLDWRIGREETESLRRLQALVAERLAVAGVGRLDNGELDDGAPSYTDASHHMGTTRMSEDPKGGVVDRNARVHGVDNLFIAGSSVFPTAGNANPTLTIVALGIRLADHLKRMP